MKEIFRLFWQTIIHGECWLTHQWQVVKDDGQVIEHVCLKCGKHVVRPLSPLQ